MLWYCPKRLSNVELEKRLTERGFPGTKDPDFMLTRWQQELFLGLPFSELVEYRKKGKLKIAIVAPPWMALPAQKYGGIEAIIASEVAHLAELGHEVFFYAPQGTTLDFVDEKYRHNVHLKTVMEKPLWENEGRLKEPTNNSVIAGHQELFHTLLEDAMDNQFNIIHNHVGFIGMHYDALLQKMGKAYKKDELPVMITTKHNPETQPEVERVLRKSQSSREVGVAWHQVWRYSAKGQRIFDAVYNGVDFSKYHPRFKQNRGWPIRAVFYARLGAKDKGPEESIKTVLLANKLLGGTNEAPKVTLTMAGRINEGGEKEYYEKHVAPYFKKYPNIIKLHPSVELNADERAQFLRDADCLLQLGYGEAPFELNLVESMASGTPVVAYNYGSSPELVTHGLNGLITSSGDRAQAANNILNCRKLDRELVYEVALRRFSEELMNKRYELLFYKFSDDPELDAQGIPKFLNQEAVIGKVRSGAYPHASRYK